MPLTIFNELPNEIWLIILLFSDHSISTVQKLSIIRPEIFHLHVSGFDVWTDSYDELFFKELHRYQSDRLLENGTSTNGKVHLVEFMKSTLKPNFRNLKPLELKELSSAQYVVFSSVDDLTEDGTSLRMLPSVVQKNIFPKSFQFPILEKLVLHCTKQTVQRSNNASLLFKLNDGIFPQLKELSFEGNGNSLTLENISLSSVEKLSFAGQSIITSIKNVNLPNLKDLTMDSGRRFHSHADEFEDLVINNEYLNFIDPMELSIREQVQRRLIKFHNPNFDTKLHMPNLTRFELNISLVDIESIRAPNHLYFFDAIPFEQLEEFKFQLEDPYRSAESRIVNSPSDIILQITQANLVEVLPRCKKNLKKLTISSAIGNNFNCDDIIAILPQLTNLVEIELDTIYATKQETNGNIIELPNLEVATLKYSSYSEYLDIRSSKLTKLNLTFFPFSVDLFATYNKAPSNDKEPSTVDYLNSFHKNFPSLDTLTIDMYTPYWAYKNSYPGSFKQPYIITRKRHLVEPGEMVYFKQLRSLHLIFNFQELFNFFNTSTNYLFHDLEKLQLHGWFDDFENTPQFTDAIIEDINTVTGNNNTIINLNIKAPKLKRFIGHFSKQAVIDTESKLYKTLFNKVKSLQFPYFPQLEELVLGTSHNTFSNIRIPEKLQNRTTDNKSPDGLRIKALKWFSPFKPYVEKMVALGDKRYRGMLDVVWYGTTDDD